MSHLRMSTKELKRKTFFEEVKSGRMTLRECARRLGLSYRQTRRSYRRFAELGDAGLVHRSRGRRSNRARPENFRDKVIKRYEERYKGFGPTLAAEKLAHEGLCVDHETLRRWLLDAGKIKRKRKGIQHRQRRQRKECFGQMVQMDGSIHRWFGADGDYDCLMGMIDDATGQRLALIDTGETTELAMRTLWAWIDKYGIPQSLYTDRKSVYVTDREPTLEEQLAGKKPMTAFAKACAKLGIEIITANSPQAKGRIERSHALYQDRFVKELALRRITTIQSANKLLRNEFDDALNTRFTHPPASPIDCHRPVPKELDLAQVFCYEHTRTVQNDFTIRFQNTHWQIEEDNRPLPKPKEKVLLRIHLDKSMQILYKDTPLKIRKLSPTQLRKRQSQKTKDIRPCKPKAPPAQKSAQSPWRQNCTLMFAQTAPKRDKR